MLQKTALLTAAVSSLILMAGSTNAAVITITGITASHGGDQYATTNATGAINGSGIDKSIDANDPSTWTMSGSAYADELMSKYLPAVDLPANNKVSWFAIDLASSQDLGTLYLFNVNYQGGPAGVNSFNIYTADTPTVGLPASPNKNTYANTGLTPQGDYDFASGGWTQSGSTTTAPKAGIGTYDLTGVSARYVAVEVLTNHGDTYQGGRVGIDEIAITAAIPEPSAALLGGLGLLALLRRRRWD